MSILVISPEEWWGTAFRELEHLREAAEDRGVDIVTVNTDEWVGNGGLSVQIGDEWEAKVGDTDLKNEKVEGIVYVPSLAFNPIDPNHADKFEEDSRTVYNRLLEHRLFFNGVVKRFERRRVKVIPKGYAKQVGKVSQVEELKSAGLPVPDTLVTSDPVDARDFVRSHDRAIVKPIGMPALPKEITEEDVEATDLEGFKPAPAQIQEYISGRDVRVYVVGGDVVGSIATYSNNTSYKDDIANGEEPDREVIETPENAAKVAAKAVDVVDQPYGAVDFIEREDGSVALLEVNSFGRFDSIQKRGIDVAGELVEYLTTKE